MFRNRWGALLFVGFVLAAVSQLVGTGKGDGALDKATRDIVEKRAEADSLAERADTIGERATTVQFAADDELIDQALGEDPTPIDQRETPAGETEELPHDTVILIPGNAVQPDPRP